MTSDNKTPTAPGDEVSADVATILQAALSDPGRLVAPTELHDDWCFLPAMEPMAEWQARAAIAAIKEAGLALIPAGELARLRRLAAVLEADPDRLGFVVVTWNQASNTPGLEYCDLHWGPGALDDARAEQDWKATETRRIGRRERHEVAAVMSLGECE